MALNGLSQVFNFQLQSNMRNISRRALMGVAGAAPIVDALKFTLNPDSQPGSITLTIPSGLTEQECTNIQYSLNGKTWVTYENHGSGLTITTPTLIAGDSVWFKGDASEISKSGSVYSNFSCTQNMKISAEGSVMSLINNAVSLTDYAFFNLFRFCTSLTTAPELPATTLASRCYGNMFYGCTSLTTAPALPATILSDYCYYGMFYGCTSLTSAPAQLPATTLASHCYDGMFYNCTSLTTAPALPATILSDYCYYQMFYGCTSLTSAPALPATTLKTRCYVNLFRGCSNLSKITMLATDISASNCLLNWVQDVAATGTFIKNSAMTTLPTGTNGIPTGWTVQDYVG